MRAFFCNIILALFLVPNVYADNELQKTFETASQPVVQKTCDDIAKLFGVKIVGVGGAEMNVVRACHFTFQTTQPYSLEEGRRLIVESASIFLNNINQVKTIRPVLAEFPFSAKRIQMSFLIIDPMTKLFKTADSLADISLKNGKITYCIADPKTENLITVHVELFEDAQALIQNEKVSDKNQSPGIAAVTSSSTKREESSFVQKFFSALTALPGFNEREKYRGSDEFEKMDWALDKFACKLAKSHQLQFFRVGDFSEVRPYHDYGFSFTSNHNMTLEQGRILGATLFEELRNAIYTFPEVEKCRRKDHDEYSKNTPYAPTPDLRSLCFKVAFWDQNVDRILPPHLAQIVLLDKVLSYYEADPKTQEVRLVYQEPFEDAIACKEAREKK